MTLEALNEAKEIAGEIHYHELAIEELTDIRLGINNISDSRNYNSFRLGYKVYPASVGNKAIDLFLAYHEERLALMKEKLSVL